MMDLCYTLAEAAQKIGLSEAVLFRLSQSFKVPQSIARKDGSFSETDKDDLIFRDGDLAFFQRVRDSLLSGASLEQIKQTFIPPSASGTISSASKTPSASQSEGAGFSGQKRFADTMASTMANNAANTAANAASGMAKLIEIQDPAPYQKTAAQGLKNYKRAHHATENKIFENLLKTDLFTAPIPTAKPSDTSAGQLANRSYATKPTMSSPLVSKDKQPSWQKLLEQTMEHPRILNSQLKEAAIHLKEQTLNTKKR